MMKQEVIKNKKAIFSLSLYERGQVFKDGLKLNQDQDRACRNIQCLPSLHITGMYCKHCILGN